MLDGKNIAVLSVTPVDYEAVEVVRIIRAMENMGARVHVISSPRKRSIRGWDRSIKVDTAIDKVSAEDFDAVILCTDCRSSDARIHLRCVQFLNKANELGKLIAAIGKGLEPVLLAQLLPDDVLLHAIAAYSYGFEKEVPLADRLIVRDTNLLIASDLMKPMSFAREIISALEAEIGYPAHEPLVGM